MGVTRWHGTKDGSHAVAETSIMAESRAVALNGTKGLLDYLRLGEDDPVAYLCMHGALHWWSRLKWLADVNALIATTPVDGALSA
jgi:hypothetical protein